MHDTFSHHGMLTSCTVMPGCPAGFSAPFGGANALGSHHLVEAMKNAFAMRMQLGDPGPDNSFLNLDDVMYNMLSMRFASQLQ